MKVKLLGWGAVVLGLISIALVSGRTSQPSQDISMLLKSANPELADADIALQECQLSIRNDRRSAENLMASVVTLDADLRLFDFENVQIATRTDGRITVRIRRTPASVELVEQASKVMALLPESLAPQAGTLTYAPRNGSTVRVQKVRTGAQNGWSKAQLFDFLSQPTSTLSVRLDGVRSKADGEMVARIRPHADAPEFFGFVDAVQRIEGAKTVSSALIFAGVDHDPEKLVSALVAIPNTLVLSATSQIGARRLAQKLLDYKETHCSA